MLTFLKVANFKSIYDSAEFSMYATREQRDRETIANVRGLRILPAAGFFGANASGKTTFIESLHYIQDLLFSDYPETRPLDVKTHQQHQDEPSEFEVEFIQSDTHDKEHLYCYRLAILQGVVERESLHEVTPQTGYENLIFSYNRDTFDFLHYGKTLENNAFAQGVKTIRSAYKSQLLFTKLAQGIDDIKNILDWFSRIVFVHPNARAVRLPERIDLDQDFSDYICEGISQADSGIHKVTFRDVDRTKVALSDASLEKLIEYLKTDLADEEEASVSLPTHDNGIIVVSYSSTSGLHFREMIAQHNNFSLPIEQESRGTGRYLHLMPVLYNHGNDSIYLIDELDAALHPHLVKRFVQSFLKQCHQNTRRQLIFTTHALELLFLDELRRDEIWFTEKTIGKANESTSSLIRLSEYAGPGGIRKGSDIVKLYLGGRLGGIPQNI